MRYFIIVITTFLLYSCTNSYNLDDSLSEYEKKLNLTSPNGIKISSSLSSLKKDIEFIIAERKEINTKVDITNIKYSPIENGYLASIDLIYEGRKISIIKTDLSFEMGKGIATRSLEKIKRTRTRNEIKLEIDGRTHYIWCEDTENCECQPKVERREGSIKVTCPGNNCKCTIKGKTQ